MRFCRPLERTGLPAGVLNVVHGRGPTVGRAIAGSPHIGLMTLTGSVEAGSAVLAETARHVTKANLELGGKAPAIVTGDAALDVAVPAVTASRVINSGQVCNRVERVYVERIADEFTERLAAAMRQTRYGDPLADASVDNGPLINAEGFEKVEALVGSAVGAGAEIVTGGRRGEGEGGFFNASRATEAPARPAHIQRPREPADAARGEHAAADRRVRAAGLRSWT